MGAAVVRIGNVADVAPGTTTTPVGTIAPPGLVVESDTRAPPAGAAASSVTVPTESVPPTRFAGARERPVSTAAEVTVSVAVLLTPATVAVRVTGPLGAAPGTVTEKVALVPPDGTVTLAGTVAIDVLELPRLTEIPAGGAVAVRITVPIAELPRRTVDGLKLKEVGTGEGVTERTAVFVDPP